MLDLLQIELKKHCLIFCIQTFDFEETKVLDLYGGMGSMALEFSSRGCPEVVTVDFIESQCNTSKM